MKHYRIEAAILAAGIILLGAFFYWGINSFAQRDRTVTVKGLAEREVKADYVIWPIVYKTTGNDLQALYADINSANSRIGAFLERNGIDKADISVDAPQIVDLKADRYASETGHRDRYNVTSITIVASTSVDEVRALIPRMGELLKEGIAISDGDYNYRVQYEFRGLNKVKPQMIEEATHNAREAAEKFAKDSDSRLGKIRQASQGLFSINDRDQYTPYIKKVRVVTTVDYYLKS